MIFNLKFDLAHTLSSKKPSHSIAFEIYHDTVFKPGDDKHERAKELIERVKAQATQMENVYGIEARSDLADLSGKNIAQMLKDGQSYLGRRDAGQVELHLRDAIRILVVAGTARSLLRNKDNLMSLTGISMKQLRERYDLSAQEASDEITTQTKAICDGAGKTIVTEVLNNCALQLSVSMPNDNGIRFEAKLPFPNVEQTFTSVTGTLLTNRVDTRAQAKKSQKPKATQDEKKANTSDKPMQKDNDKRSASKRSQSKSKSKQKKQKGGK